MNENENRRAEELRLQEEQRRVTIAYQNATVARIVQLINYLAAALVVLLLLRIVLRLFGANPDNKFAQVIHDISNPFVTPFAGLFGNPELNKSFVLDINALVGIVVYAILAWLVGRFIWLVGSRTR